MKYCSFDVNVRFFWEFDGFTGVTPPQKEPFILKWLYSKSVWRSAPLGSSNRRVLLEDLHTLSTCCQRNFETTQVKGANSLSRLYNNVTNKKRH